jgi:hypothetical protein
VTATLSVIVESATSFVVGLVVLVHAPAATATARTKDPNRRDLT